MMAETPTETIAQLLIDIREDLERQASFAQAESESSANACTSELENIQNQIDELNRQINAAQQTISNADATLNDLVGKIADANSRNSTLHTDLANEQAARADQASLVGQWDVDYDEAIWACEEAIRIIDQLNTGDGDSSDEQTLIELSNKMLNQMTETMKDSYGVTIANLA